MNAYDLVSEHVIGNVYELVTFLASKEHDYSEELQYLQEGPPAETSKEACSDAGWEIKEFFGSVSVFWNTEEQRGYQLDLQWVKTAGKLGGFIDVLSEFDPDDYDDDDNESLGDIEDIEDTGEHWDLLIESEEIETTKQEVLTYVQVTSTLAAWLEDEGEAVQEVFGLYVWGRTTYGQLIEDDAVIIKIADKMK